MSFTLVALIGIALMLGIMMLRMPVAFALMLAGLLGTSYMIGMESAIQLLASDTYRQFTSYGLSVIPLFVLMGQIAFRAGISERLYAAAYKWVGSLPGGVAATTILGSIGFSTFSGSNSATTATMGAVALPEMKKYRYDPALTGGSVAIGGTLGVLIPPSTALIIIAIQSEQSIAQLFVAALVPGLVVGVLLVATVLVLCWRRPALGPPGPKVAWGERLRSLTGVAEALALFALVIGGLYLGWFTPTEAAAVGAFGAIIVALARRSLSAPEFWRAVVESLRISAMVVLLVTGAVVFGRFLSLTRLPFDLAEWVGGLAIPPTAILLLIVLIYLSGGAFMDALGFLVISIPIFFPLAESLGFDPVWFTIIVTLVTTIGAVTPPVGVNLYIVSALDKDLDVIAVSKGVFVFFIPYALAIALFIAVPGLVITG
ncbi:TRAP transporter large permease [Actinobacteria bacterium YIM 96077]|uniref:C4-dicarboxylate ABC transporter permease n=1 Tax=Phytoactinopolyspora halophila TaxID=1981511 RepID=A0A329QVW7_9ACTN|nr:TRAP transporter large permease [Phytoactinopolyspora halophila]AYY14995.1 TRAP transporter large permease [Actinobacteria bacterium YIM 96077]RAW15452.1 C4-dicarboxylate ABC transporter permease [Phytoactinopolyspora halophila]